VTATITLFFVTLATSNSTKRYKLISRTTARAGRVALGKRTQSAVSGDSPRHWDDWRF
jgi:hypothetical protein